MGYTLCYFSCDSFIYDVQKSIFSIFKVYYIVFFNVSLYTTFINNIFIGLHLFNTSNSNVLIH